MCGIAGIVTPDEQNPGPLDRQIRQMLAMIRHRGPDQFGIYQDTTATLGSARLSIIDLTTGQQPIGNEDGSLWIVFNGEIFNYVELRAGLETRGHRFETSTDTEALLHLYEEFGPACLQRLNGQFAFAIWDARRRRLFLARDRMGIRPLYYMERNGSLLFASEAKALLSCDGVSGELDPVTVDQIFTYWAPLPGRSVFRGIQQLPPGHYLTYARGEARIRRYWEFGFPAEPAPLRSEDEYLEEFTALLTDATRIRLRSDVPVGAYLSGGLDSSTLTRLISRETNTSLATFSVTFEDPDFDESAFQLRMARLLGARHEIVNTTHADIARVFPTVIWHTETPVMRTAPAPMFMLSQLARDSGIKVVVTGEGADEILGGYDIFKESAIRRFWARFPGSVTRPLLLRRLYSDIPGMANMSSSFLRAFFAAGLTETGSPYYSHLVRWRNNARTRRFLSREALPGVEAAQPELPCDFQKWNHLQQAQYLEATVFLSEYLLSAQGDRMGMAHSVESRLPFLDYRVVEFCNRLPANLKLRVMTEKYLLRRMARELLPAEVWQRPKRPYRAPIHRSFFCAGAPEYVRELLSPDELRDSGLFNVAAVGQLVTKLNNGHPLGETDDMALAGILSTQLSHFHFVSNFTAKPPLPQQQKDIKICGAQFASRLAFR